jgi:hypothetical protein
LLRTYSRRPRPSTDQPGPSTSARAVPPRRSARFTSHTHDVQHASLYFMKLCYFVTLFASDMDMYSWLMLLARHNLRLNCYIYMICCRNLFAT